MPLFNSTINGTTYLQPVVYKDIPILGDIWFYVGCFAILLSVIWGLWKWLEYRQRTRLLQIINYPDNTFVTFVHRKFVGQIFHTKSDEVTSDGEEIYFDYKFDGNCVKRGVWGSRIEYDYGILEPINPKSRLALVSDSFNNIIKFIESIANTKLLSELLLSTKWKDFINMMLWILVVGEALIIIALIIVLFNIFGQHTSLCVLTPDNSTIATIRQACRGVV